MRDDEADRGEHADAGVETIDDELRCRPIEERAGAAGRDVELPLDERVRQLARHEPEAGPRAEPAYATSVSGQRPALVGIAGAASASDANATAAAGTITTKPRSVLFSPNSRRPRSVRPPSSGNAKRRDIGVANHAVCATPARTNATIRNSAQASGSTRARWPQRSNPVSGGSETAGLLPASAWRP